MKKSKTRKLNTIFIIFIFIFGFLIMSYPFISDFYYRIESNQVIKDFEITKKTISKEEIEKRLELANAYNASIFGETDKKFKDPYTTEQKKEGVKAYAKSLEIHERIGHIKIPKIDQDVPIYAGTDESVLQRGIGHMEGTSLPVGGENTHCVLTGHRGLPSAKIFTDLDKLKKGDKFYIYNIEKTLAYEIDQIKVVEPSQFEDLLIHRGKDEVTLLTCTPYMINSHRLLLRGHRIPYVEKVLQKEVIKTNQSNYLKYLFITLAIVLFILMLILLKNRKKRKQVKLKSEI